MTQEAVESRWKVTNAGVYGLVRRLHSMNPDCRQYKMCKMCPETAGPKHQTEISLLDITLILQNLDDCIGRKNGILLEQKHICYQDNVSPHT